MNYYPLFRVWSWNNGMRCISFYILIMVYTNHVALSIFTDCIYMCALIKKNISQYTWITTIRQGIAELDPSWEVQGDHGLLDAIVDFKEKELNSLTRFCLSYNHVSIFKSSPCSFNLLEEKASKLRLCKMRIPEYFAKNQKQKQKKEAPFETCKYGR